MSKKPVFLPKTSTAAILPKPAENCFCTSYWPNMVASHFYHNRLEMGILINPGDENACYTFAKTEYKESPPIIGQTFMECRTSFYLFGSQIAVCRFRITGCRLVNISDESTYVVTSARVFVLVITSF